MEKLATVTYATSKPRAVAGFAGGAVTGGFLIALLYLWDIAETLGVDHLREYGVQKGFGVFVAASFFWAVGLAIFGLPSWLWLHRRYLRQWPIALLAGIAIGFLGTLALQILLTSGSGLSIYDSGGPKVIDGHRTLHGWMDALKVSGLFSAAGCIVALVIWRIAYRRQSSII